MLHSIRERAQNDGICLGVMVPEEVNVLRLGKRNPQLPEFSATVRCEIFKHRAIHAHPYATKAKLIAAGAYPFPALLDIGCVRQCRFEFVQADLRVNAFPKFSP
jgi:hypothetical protein